MRPLQMRTDKDLKQIMSYQHFKATVYNHQINFMTLRETSFQFLEVMFSSSLFEMSGFISKHWLNNDFFI